MRIITRPDFDGVVCAVLLQEALDSSLPIQWVQPNDIQNQSFPIDSADVIANLPFHERCGLWFDHHVSNAVDHPFKGLYRIVPSAAGLVYEYFQNKIAIRFKALVEQADKIDSAQLTLDEIQKPENHPYVLLSMAVSSRNKDDLDFCDHLVSLLRNYSIEGVFDDPAVQQRCDAAVAANHSYEQYLKQYTTVQEAVSITDFRSLQPAPDGNRFLVYSLFPHTMVNVKVFNESDSTAVKLGHSIINRRCRVNVGQLMAQYGGGGHRGAGACRIARFQAEATLSQIIAILVRNEPIE